MENEEIAASGITSQLRIAAGGYEFVFVNVKPKPKLDVIELKSDFEQMLEMQERAEHIGALLKKVEQKTGVSFSREVRVDNRLGGLAGINRDGILDLSSDFFEGSKDTSEQVEEFILFHEAAHLFHRDNTSHYLTAMWMFDLQTQARRLVDLYHKDPEGLSASILRNFPDVPCFQKTLEHVSGYLSHNREALTSLAGPHDASAEAMLARLTTDPQFSARFAALPAIETPKNLLYGRSDISKMMWMTPHTADRLKRLTEEERVETQGMDDGALLRLKRDASDIKIRDERGLEVAKFPPASQKEIEQIGQIIECQFEPLIEQLEPTMNRLEMYVRAIEMRADMYAAHHMPDYAEQFMNKRKAMQASRFDLNAYLFPGTLTARSHPSADEMLEVLRGFMPPHEKQPPDSWVGKMQQRWEAASQAPTQRA